MTTIPEWAILAFFAVILFFGARASKGMLRCVIYIGCVVLFGLAFEKAIGDPTFVVILVIIGTCLILFTLRKHIKAKRKKEEDRQRREQQDAWYRHTPPGS